LLGQFSLFFVCFFGDFMDGISCIVQVLLFSSLLFSGVAFFSCFVLATSSLRFRCVCDCVWLSLVEVMSTSAARTVYRELMREARLFDRQPILKAFLKRPHSEAYEISRPIAELPEEALAQHAGYMRLAMQECLDHVPIWRVFDHLLV
jgi:hypothetical protein